MGRPRYALVVDPVACDGAGVCAELLPERITSDPWGFPVVEPGELPASVIDFAQRAVAGCPRSALILVRLGASVTDTARPAGRHS